MNTKPNTIHALIEQQAAQRPQAPYAVSTDHDTLIRFGELARSCRAVAALLRQHGLHVGNTVSVVMPNSLQTLRILLGVMSGGFCVNPVNLLAQPEQMQYVLEHSDCHVVFVTPEWESRIRTMLQAIQRAVTVIVVPGDDTSWPDLSTPALAPTHPPAPDAAALLMYTSGTTGLPKGVILTHANLVANAQTVCTEHALGADDRVLVVLPLYHINAFVVTMLAPLAQGGSLAMAAHFSSSQFWDQAARTQCTWLNLVPTMIAYLIEAGPTQHTTGAIRFCRSASAALAPEHHRAFERMFGIGIIETMGLTETAAPCFSNPLQATLRRIGSVGRASGCAVRVVDANLSDLPDGSIGELLVRGPQVMPGYYKNEDATRTTFTPDGWLRTGDLGYRDADGFFFVTGRIKEIIIKGGENIAPREVDEVLLRHPAVLDAAAVGVPDPHYGQEIGVCVVLRNGIPCSEDTLRDFCHETLGRYKTPKHYRFVTELPRGPSGKVQRLKLLPLFG